MPAVNEKLLSSVRAKLDAINNQNKKSSSLIWRPPRGQEVSVRIVPYRHAPDPFNELYFHYDIGQVKKILCLQTHGIDESCPACDYAKFLLTQEKSDKNYAIYKRLKAKMRVYVPIVVRGKEEEGVKFWGIGKGTYNAIGALFIDPEYGDISDPVRGRDIKILATAPSPQYIYGQVAVKPGANPSPLSANTELAKKLITECPNVFDAFEKMTTENIKAAVDTFVEEGDQNVPQGSAGAEDSDDEPSSDTGDLDNLWNEIQKNKSK